jgi:hypothetical protein
MFGFGERRTGFWSKLALSFRCRVHHAITWALDRLAAETRTQGVRRKA